VSLSCIIVDDNEDFLASAKNRLENQGVSVIGQASSGDETMRLAEALRPQVALVDVELGDEDGIELARRLTSGGLAIPVVLISLRERDELAELIEGSGAIGFLRKQVLGAQAIEDLMSSWRQNHVDPDARHAS
jgi:DNA-binding NarL/FixJ family response regulator